MVTLDMVPLRSKMPHTGRVTLRYALPTVKIDVPEDVRAARLLRIATTPQVEADGCAEGAAGADVETTARKGAEAR
jgi:hypothetical protein